MDARWERRAARQEAQRRRIPKHGLGYVRLVQRLLKDRAARARDEASDATSPPPSANDGMTPPP
jgi:hypothetical protein